MPSTAAGLHCWDDGRPLSVPMSLGAFILGASFLLRKTLVWNLNEKVAN